MILYSSLYNRLKCLTVNLYGALSLDPTEKDVKKKVPLQSGSSVSKQTFFPLAVDDYFMSVAILSKRFTSPKAAVSVLNKDLLIA